jgi:hypothetical protein
MLLLKKTSGWPGEIQRPRVDRAGRGRLVDLAAPTPTKSFLLLHHWHSEVKLEANLKLPGYVRCVRDLAEI